MNISNELMYLKKLEKVARRAIELTKLINAKIYIAHSEQELLDAVDELEEFMTPNPEARLCKL